jgi:hypothetical protein
VSGERDTAEVDALGATRDTPANAETELATRHGDITEE